MVEICHGGNVPLGHMTMMMANIDTFTMPRWKRGGNHKLNKQTSYWQDGISTSNGRGKPFPFITTI